MRGLKHQSIVRLIDNFEDAREIIIVMQLCHGRELWSELDQHVRFTEQQTKSLLLPILRAVSYLHQRGLVHRDLKLENIMTESVNQMGPDENHAQFKNVKVIDFGLATWASSDRCKIETATSRGVRRMNSTVGTLYYVSPQVLESDYTSSCDLWSVGVIAFMLLAGSPPFSGRTDADIRSRIASGRPNFGHSALQRTSPAAMNLLRGLLCPDESGRLTAEEALNHPFFAETRC
jgi:calcium-dependent protein kinase